MVPKPGFMFKTTTYTSQQQDITHTKKVKIKEKFLGKKEKLSEKVNCDLAVVHYGSVKFAATSQCMFILFKCYQSLVFCSGHLKLLNWSNALQELL